MFQSRGVGWYRIGSIEIAKAGKRGRWTDRVEDRLVQWLGQWATVSGGSAVCVLSVSVSRLHSTAHQYTSACIISTLHRISYLQDCAVSPIPRSLFLLLEIRYPRSQPLHQKTHSWGNPENAGSCQLTWYFLLQKCQLLSDNFLFMQHLLKPSNTWIDSVGTIVWL